MKKIFTSLVLLLSAITMSAAETVVGEDNYAPNGASFTWNFEIDLSTQKFTAVVDLSTCNADNTNENVFSVGTDINAYFSNKQMAGNIHFYYTPSTKTLSCQYISSNKSYGAYKYITPLENIEGEVSIDLSQQYGLKVNGEQIFNPGQLTKLLTWSNMQCGSAEGSTRSYATVKQARVVDTEFVVEEATEVKAAAKVLYDGAYTRFEESTVNYTATSLTDASLVIPQLTIGDKVLGDITVSGLTYENMESSGNNSLGYVALFFSNAKATISNLGALGTELGLTEGQELTMGEVEDYDVYFYGPYLYMELSFTVGEKEIVYTFNTDDPITNTYTSTLKTNLNSLDGTYENHTMQVCDYGDGFADLTFNDIRFEAFSTIECGALTLKEVPYTVNDLGEKEFDVTGLEAAVETPNFEHMRSMLNVAVEGKVSGDEAYFKLSGLFVGFNAVLTFGEPIAEYTTYTGYQAVYGGDGSTSEKSDGTLAIRDEGDGTYTFILTDVYGQSALMFTAQGTVHSNGDVTYTAENAPAAMHDDGWEGYTAYITTTEAKTNGDKFYGVFDVDIEGWASQGYSYYGCTAVFGEEFTGINNVTSEFDNQPVQIYNLNGVRMNALQRGINIVRNANGKTMKVVKK